MKMRLHVNLFLCKTHEHEHRRHYTNIRMSEPPGIDHLLYAIEQKPTNQNSQHWSLGEIMQENTVFL